MLVGLLALVGGGCQNPPGTEVIEKAATNTVSETQSNEFTLSAEAKGAGMVNLKWTIPGEVGKDTYFRVIHSSKSEPIFPGAYWYQVPNVEREASWAKIPTGTRYFRVCEYKMLGNACLRYSNTIQLDVK